MSGIPTVSVVVPLYNKRSTVERTIDSVLAQTYADFELIVVDDESTDGGAELVEAKYRDPRIRVHRQANAGPGAARNQGARLARGKFVTFLDSDDDWRPELLERAVAALEAHPECAVFTSAFYLEPEHVDRWVELRTAGYTEGVWRASSAMSRHELNHCLAAFNSCTAVYRSEVVAAYGGFYENRCTFGEDVYFWIQILLNHAFYRHMQPLAHYHMEDSELGLSARKNSVPLEPVLTEPEKVRAACPPEFRDVLELWLARHTLRAAFVQLERGDTAKATWLIEAYPRVSAWRLDYLKVRLRLAAPGPWKLARRIWRAAS